MTYQCHNRGEFAPSVTVQDGWQNSWARRMVDMPFRMSPYCEYTLTELGQKDKGCDGCKWKAGAGVDPSAEPVQVGDGLADLRKGEGGPVGVGGQADVGKPSDVAEQRRHLEQIWPGAAAYQPTEEK